MTGLLRLLARLPRRWLQAVGAGIGRLHWLFGSKSAKVTCANLRLCFPDLPEAQLKTLARQSLAETGKTLMEMPAIWFGKTARLDGWIGEVHGERLLAEALADGKGLLILLPHAGNWELFNVFFRRYGSFTGLYQPPRQARLRGFIAAARQHHGNEVVPNDAAGLRRLYQTLAAGGTVAVLPDQVPRRGSFADFFGQPALTDELCHRLVRRTGAKPLGLCLLRQANGRFAVHLLPLDETDGAAQAKAVNRLVEQVVALAPAQYQWEYKRFRRRPTGAPSPYH